MRDRRQVHKVWEACNRLGEWHTYAHVGTGKNRVLVTLHVGAMIPSDTNRIGEVYFH